MSQTVKTFVIFDTETTGLPSPGNNPRITELSFIALLRDELLKSSTPRVVNKLLLCFNPQKNISYKSSSITGLYNDELEAYSPFKTYASLICSFLTTLPQPACLVAHNGNGFDFPLLISELNNANQPVPVNILCADSLEGFRELDGLPKQPDFVINNRKNRSFTALVETPKSEANKETLDPNICHSVSPSKQARLSEDVHLLWSIDAVTPQHSSTVSSPKGPNAKLKRGEIVRDEATNKARRNLFSNQTSVDKGIKSETLSSSGHSESLPLISNKLNNVADIPYPDSPETPDNFSPWSTNSEAEVMYAAEQAELNFIPEPVRTMKVQPPQETPNSISVCDTGSKMVGLSSNNINNRKKPLSYSLPQLYKRIFSQDPIESHAAEDDCKTLLCVIRTKPLSFCQWCDKNAEPLRNVNPMY